MVPSAMTSRGSGTVAKALSASPPLLWASSTTLIALVPMSSPNVAGFLPSPNSAIFGSRPSPDSDPASQSRSESTVSPVRCGRKLSIVVTVYNGALIKPSTLLTPHRALPRFADPDPWGLQADLEPATSMLSPAQHLLGRFPVTARLYHPPLRDDPTTCSANFAVPNQRGASRGAGVDETGQGTADMSGHRCAHQPGRTRLAEPIRSVDEALEGDAAGNGQTPVDDEPAPKGAARTGSGSVTDADRRQIGVRGRFRDGLPADRIHEHEPVGHRPCRIERHRPLVVGAANA